MDPNAALEGLLSLSKEVVADSVDFGRETKAEDAFDLAERFLNLHNWIVSGGFLPDLWRKSSP